MSAIPATAYNYSRMEAGDLLQYTVLKVVDGNYHKCVCHDIVIEAGRDMLAMYSFSSGKRYLFDKDKNWNADWTIIKKKI